MHPGILVERRVHGPQQPQVRRAQHLEQRERLHRVGPLVPEGGRPCVLVVCLQLDTVARQDRAEAPGADDLGVAQMREDLRRRPAVG
jgi:hypothetical protein